MMNRAVQFFVLVLAIIGAIAAIVILAMWLMHLSMMRGDMMLPGASR
jgi:hypothetical protein